MLHTIGRDRAEAAYPAGLSKVPSFPPIPVVALGMSLGSFFVIGYVACVVFYLLFPDLLLNHVALSLLLPGFKLLDWPNFVLGLVESFGLGWYVALIFGPLFNYFVGRSR